MAINQQYPILDGVAPSFADIAVKCQVFDGPLIDVYDIQAINTGSSIEVGEQRGASGGRVTRRTTGQASFEASMTLYRTGYQKLLRNLSTVAPSRGSQKLVGLVHFDIQVQHSPPGSDELYEYVIKGCRVLGRTLNGSEGTDADVVEVPLSTVEIVDIVDGAEVAMI